MGEKLRAAVIGMGGRGLGMLETVSHVKDLTIVVVCDIPEDRAASLHYSGISF